MVGVDKIIREYERGTVSVVEQALRNIFSRELQDELEKLLNVTEQNLMCKWREGKKAVRTKFALEIFPNYPSGYLSLSLYLDALINLFDDILDELMNKEERALCRVETIKVLTFLFSHNRVDKNVLSLISSYFSKILCVAASEMWYLQKMQKEENLDKLISYSIECYNYRAYDVDIFFELPMLAIYGRIDGRLLKIARLFRAINLIVKDCKDMEHDIKNETFTPVLVIATKYRGDAEKFIKKLLNHYRSKLREAIAEINPDEEVYHPALKLAEMAEEEMRKFDVKDFSKL